MDQTVFDGAFEGLPVLVTGHSGFKGSWLSIWLREIGACVAGFSLDPPTDPSNFELCQLGKRIPHIYGDVRDADKVTEAIQTYEPQIVFHLAAQPLVLASYREPKATFDTNVGGAINLLEAIRKTKSVRVFVAVTTDKVYENRGWLRGYSEDDHLGGYDPYSASKAMVELAVQSYRRSWLQRWVENSSEKCFSDHPVAIASARSGNVIGGGDFARYRLVPDCMRSLRSGAPVEVRNPQSVRSWEHVLEPLSGYLWLAVQLLREGDEFGGAWNFGAMEQSPITCEAVVRKAIALWGGGSWVPASTVSEGHEEIALGVNWEKAAGRLAWRPIYSWEEALSETVDWWKDYGKKLSDGRPVDMYDVCAGQIMRYVSAARRLGVKWASSCA